MASSTTTRLIDDFLGSAHVFISAMSGVMEETLLTGTVASDLTLPQLKILKLLAASGTGNIGDLAAFLGVSNAAASKTVEKLVRRKLLRRSEATGDRRASAVTLSDAGRRLMADYDALRHRKLARLFRDISTVDLRHTAGLLDRLSARIVAQRRHPGEVCLQCGIHLQKRCLVREAAFTQCSYEQHRSKSKVRSNVSDRAIPPAEDQVSV